MATETSKESAQAEAMKILSRAGNEGVRVVSDTGKPVNSLGPEDILFERIKPKGDEKVFIQNIDDAPVCYTLDDFYATDGRTTINRLFRAYLDKHNLTATEAMHSAREMKRLLDDGTLLFSAVAKVATFQAAKLEDTNANERRETLFAYVDQINHLAQKTLQRPMPRIRDTGLNEGIAELKASAAPEELDYLIRSALATELVENRSFVGKLGQVVDWAVIAEDPAVVERFFTEVDSAILLHNASTQFADGGEFGMGAEIGIATGKMHARGPVGLEQLTSFKYLVHGEGQTRP